MSRLMIEIAAGIMIFIIGLIAGFIVSCIMVGRPTKESDDAENKAH